MAVEEASFNISMDSISLGFKSLILPSIKGKPSTTYRGSLLAVIEPLPRTRIEGEAPGLLSLNTATPAALPCSDSNAFPTTDEVKASGLICAVAPVKSDFLAVP